MKKILTALLVSVNGCQTAPPDSEPTQQTLMVKAESTLASDQVAINIAATLEQIIAGINFKPAVSIFKKASSKNENDKQNNVTNTKRESSQASPTSLQDSDTKGTESIEPLKAADPTPAPKHSDTDPDATLSVTVKATPTLPPAPTPIPPAPTPEPVIEEPSFDIGYWISYAQSYAQGLGLRLESSAVDCWDNSIGAGPHSTCLERDITSRLNRYANDSDITDVWIWYESTGGNCYDIYIGYA